MTRDAAADETARDAARRAAAARLAGRTWPAPLLDVLATLRRDGGRAYLVGGTVRDAVLGKAADAAADIGTDLVPGEVTARFARVEPIGLQHGTVLVLEAGCRFEVTTFRREGAYLDARRPERVEFTLDPLEDLARRDLTVNALAWDPEARELLDPFGGALDLERGVLRAVGDPLDRFREDALRPLRVARLAAQLGMDPEPRTRAALGAVIDRARLVALERVGDELRRLMGAERPSVGLDLLRESGLLELWMPELARCWGEPQNRWHAYDVYEHLLRTCDAAPADKPRVRWAALLHDVGKPDTRVIRNGDATFYGHEMVGATLAERVLERLRFPGEERRAIVHLVREHMFDYRSEWSDAALRRWLRRVGVDHVADLFDLRIADVIGKGVEPAFAGPLEEMRARIEALLQAPRALAVRDLAVTGEDVMRALGVGPGPEVGVVLESLLQSVLDDPALNRRDVLLERLRAQVARTARPPAVAGEGPGRQP